MKNLKKNSYVSTISVCMSLLISFFSSNPSKGAPKNVNPIEAAAENKVDYDYWRSNWEIENTITINNYKYIAEDFFKRMDSFMASSEVRRYNLDNFSKRLNGLTHFNNVLGPQLKVLCNYDHICLEKFEQIAKRIPQETSIFRLLQNAKDAEISVTAEYQKFKKKFNDAEKQIANGGYLIFSESGFHMQYIVYILFRDVQYMILSSYNMSPSSEDIFLKSSFTLTGGYSPGDQVYISVDLAKPRLHIRRTFCATSIMASLDLSTGRLLAETSSGVRRLPSSYFLNLIDDYEIEGTCNKKLFGSPSLQLEANNKLNVSYKEFSYKTYHTDPFGMGGGSGWKTHTKRSALSAQIF